VFSVSRDRPEAILHVLNAAGQVEATYEGEFPENFTEQHAPWSANPVPANVMHVNGLFLLWFPSLPFADRFVAHIEEAGKKLVIEKEDLTERREAVIPEMRVGWVSYSSPEENQRLPILQLVGNGSPPNLDGVPADFLSQEAQPITLGHGRGLTALVSPANHAVAITSFTQGTLVRRLREISPEFLMTVLRSEITNRAMSHAKQVALAAMMYAADHDDTLPGPDGIVAKLEPYLRNLFGNEVQWLFEGGPLFEIESPTTTPMLEIQLPWGRAVGYTDGHAEFHADE
jgi:hypothetical protein